MVDLESRSMRESLMFYGIAESETHENCEDLVKMVCKKTLKIATADQMVFDRAHRFGNRSGAKLRPMVVKFYYFHEQELVRKRFFEYSDPLNAANMGIGAELPNDIQDARKLSYPAMKKAKSEGKNVKFLGKKTVHPG